VVVLDLIAMMLSLEKILWRCRQQKGGGANFFVILD
jgi:hypothetical protein